jgi:hypothetical protein
MSDKDTLDGISGILGVAEEKIGEPEVLAIETIHNEIYTEKKI